MIRWGGGSKWDRPFRLLAFDCDGTLTDGDVDRKRIDSKDGWGLYTLPLLKVIVTGGEATEALKEFAHRVGIVAIVAKSEDKAEDLGAILHMYDIPWEQVIYIGDDIPDLDCIKRAGLGICVRDGMAEVRRKADYVTWHRGGHGAIREVCDRIRRGRA